jgi:hypothetical protein
VGGGGAGPHASFDASVFREAVRFLLSFINKDKQADKKKAGDSL